MYELLLSYVYLVIVSKVFKLVTNFIWATKNQLLRHKSITHWETGYHCSGIFSRITVCQSSSHSWPHRTDASHDFCLTNTHRLTRLCCGDYPGPGQRGRSLKWTLYWDEPRKHQTISFCWRGVYLRWRGWSWEGACRIREDQYVSHQTCGHHRSSDVGLPDRSLCDCNSLSAKVKIVVQKARGRQDRKWFCWQWRKLKQTFDLLSCHKL